MENPFFFFFWQSRRDAIKFHENSPPPFFFCVCLPFSRACTKKTRSYEKRKKKKGDNRQQEQQAWIASSVTENVVQFRCWTVSTFSSVWLIVDDVIMLLVFIYLFFIFFWQLNHQLIRIIDAIEISKEKEKKRNAFPSALKLNDCDYNGRCLQSIKINGPRRTICTKFT